MRGSAVTRSTLRQQIADALRDEVLACRLRPGQEFTVKEIAEQYGVSATPVREALVDLSAQGLLDSVQHRGFRVHEYSLDDYRAMTEARNLVAEGIFRGVSRQAWQDRAGASTAPRDTGDALVSVRRRGEEAQRAAAQGDLNVLIGYDLRFWRELSMIFGNPYIADFLHKLRLMSWMCTVPLMRREADLKGALWAGHTDLVDALLRGEPETAQAIMKDYNAHSLALVERLAAG